METQTFLWLLLAAMLALGMSLIPYFHKGKKWGSRTYILAFLRFLGIFGLLVLLVDPKIKDVGYTVIKPNLAVMVDNSTSVGADSLAIRAFLETLQQDTEVQERFNVGTYAFGKQMRPTESFPFKDRETNIERSLSTLKEVFSKEKTVVALLTDGNQTIGSDYLFSDLPPNFVVYPVAVGDTTSYEDLGIGPIITNTYAFLKNKFPLETFVVYKGKKKVTKRLRIEVNGETVFSEDITLSENQNLKAIQTTLDAKSIGTKTIRVRIDPLEAERNKANNSREASVEVIDEKTNIGLVTSLLHPDIGALKKAIESNEQRQVFVFPPSAPSADLDDMDILILYQPKADFAPVADYLKKKGTNTFLITGAKTDYGVVNRMQQDFQVELGYPEQELLGQKNNGFVRFDVSELDLDGFPPLASTVGPITFAGEHEPLLGTSIRGTAMEWPLLTLLPENGSKRAVLFGENLWKWRMQSYRNTGSFSNFDGFLGKLMRYLSIGTSRDRLNVSYSKRYQGSSAAVVKATFFDQAYVFDPNGQLTITVTETSTNTLQSLPMVLRNGFFEADLTALPPGDYAFAVKVAQEDITQTGNFTIADFDMEKQMVSTDHKKLQQLASLHGGQLYFMDAHKGLLTDLKTNDAYLPTRKGQENVVSLLDYIWVLAIIVLAFALEWFIRKYHGLT